MARIKTIDVQAKEWHDKINGNSYFAGTVTVNYQLPEEKVFQIPLQYGYGEHYLQKAGSVLRDAGYTMPYPIGSITRFCREQGIILRHSIQKKCLKKELKAFE